VIAMPSYEAIQDEIRSVDGPHEIVRHKYLQLLSEKTGRNIITYYCGVAQKSESQKRRNFAEIGLSDNDKKNLIEAACNLNSTRGLDIILHIPSEGINSEIANIELVINFLQSKFGTNVRALIPQIVTSSGTLIAISCKEILMGNYSSIGPIDPKIGGLSTNGILDEVDRALIETQVSPVLSNLWSAILSNYDQVFVERCQKSLLKVTRVARSYLISNMFKGDSNAEQKAKRVMDDLGDLSLRKSNNSHISLKHAKEIGINVTDLGEMVELQHILLSIHYLYLQTFTKTAALKIIENHHGHSFIQDIRL